MILEPIFLYCDRTGPGLWDEPFSAAASFVLVLAALGIWRRAEGLAVLRRMALCILALGLAAMTLHLLPSRLTLGLTLAAVLLTFVLYFHAANRDFLGLSPGMSAIVTLLILPFAIVSLPLIAVIKGASSSLAYVALPVLLFGYGVLARPEHPATARGLSVGAGILVAAIAVRSLDSPLCSRLPSGTHFLWVLMVAWLLWHLCAVYRAHMLAARAAGR